MTLRELGKLVPEYDVVIRAAHEEGWLNDLLRVHAQPCTTDEAASMIGAMHLPRDMRLYFRPGKRTGRAGCRRGRYKISLPDKPGGRLGHLRVGLVLHEAAHIFDHMAQRSRAALPNRTAEPDSDISLEATLDGHLL